MTAPRRMKYSSASILLALMFAFPIGLIMILTNRPLDDRQD